MATALLIELYFFSAPLGREISMLRHAEPVSGRVVGHEIRSLGKGSRFFVTVNYDTPSSHRETEVAVSGSTYDAAWDGARVAFYVDSTDPTNAMEEAPTIWKAMGNVSIVLLMNGAFIGMVFLTLFSPNDETKKNREALRNFKLAEMFVREVKQIEPSKPDCYVSGSYLDDTEKRWNVTMLQVGRTVHVGEKIAVLYTDGKEPLRVPEELTGVEIAP